MSKLIHIAFTALIILLAPAAGQAAGDRPAVLSGVSAGGGPGQSRIKLDFDRIPAWDIRVLGQKLEIRLKDARATPNLGSLPEDENIVKTFVARDRDDLVVSVLLRRLPASAVATPDTRSHRLAVDIRWQKENGIRPAIVFDLPGMPGYRRVGSELKATGRYTSVWQGRWREFLGRPHTPVTIVPKPHWTLPLLPPPEGIDDENKSALLESRWQDLILPETANLAPPARAASLEALVRIGRYEEAARRLATIEKLPLDALAPLRTRIRYIEAVLKAKTERTFEAQVLLERLSGESLDRALAEAVWILQVETSLVNGNPDHALELLAGRDAAGHGMEPVVARRKADALVMKGKFEQALSLYRQLDFPNIDASFSLAMYARACLATHNIEQARLAYSRLAEMPDLAESRSLLARFAALTLNRTRGQIIEQFDALQNIRWQKPESEAARRVVMLLTDIMAPASNTAGIQKQLATYDEIATRSGNLDLRLEAELKAAVLLHLAGDDRHAVQRLETLLRRTSRGLLRPDAGALLAELLPETIRGYLNDGQPLKALALVERHRDLLLQQHMPWDFLARIARAFSDLSLNRRANRIFLFLFDRAKNPTHRGEAALAVAENFAELGLWSDCLLYADRAAEHFRLEQNLARAFVLQLRARMAAWPVEKTRAWLENKGIPETAAALSLAAQFYWQLGQYSRVTELLRTLESLEDLPATDRLRLAEAALRSGQEALALTYFRQLAKHRLYGAQARYRMAGILLEQSRTDEATGLYRDLAKESNEGTGAWQRLAQDRLRELPL
ncbi:MAG: hypothetical protein D6751_02800 [Deltaproteobacteria bacterium]|nr:MAG: hypothetical protein D6751_02800 [Deltaproteobacteria bacterium]